MLIGYLCFLLLFPLVSSQCHGVNLHARNELDSLLQDCGFTAFSNPKTGDVYQGHPPSNLTGVRVAGLRLRTGSLLRRGVSRYKEFRIPTGVVVNPYAERVAFVYQNLGNWSSCYYHLNDFNFLAPVLGLLAYDASNLSARDLLPLEMGLTGDPITVSFSHLVSNPVSDRISARCVHFRLNGSFELSAVVNQSSCLFSDQGHFSIVSKSPSSTRPHPAPRGGRRVLAIVCSLIGGVALLIIAAVVTWVRRKRKKIRQMEAASEVGVELPMTKVGETKAPAAPEMRTRPTIETEFAP